MTLRSISPIVFALTAASVLPACRQSPTTPPEVPPVPPAVTTRGESIYVGKVFPLREPASAPTYVYERRVEDRGDTRTSTHVTRDPSGAVVLAETAVHDRAYALQSYTLHANQLGQTGGVDVVGDRITFRLNDKDGPRTSVERQAGPVVVGPTLVGYIVENLAQLRTGKTRRVRMAIPERMETIGFELAVDDAAAGHTRVVMKPTSPFLKLAVDPIHFTFETTTKAPAVEPSAAGSPADGTSEKLVRLEGRVPTKIWKNGRLADFDARVEYSFVADRYR